MTKLDVTAQVEIDDHDLDERVIHAAAEQLLRQIDLTARYGGATIDMIHQKMTEIVEAKVEAMLDKPVVQVDRFGDVMPGPKKTFREVFAETAEKFLEERVNNDGRKSEGGYHSVSRLEYLIKKTSLDHMEYECRTVASKFKSELQEMAKKAIASVVAEQVRKVA